MAEACRPISSMKVIQSQTVHCCCKELNPYSLGMLIALYEHKVFVQSVLWNINPFDQWGVEKGKEIANQLLPILNGEQTDLDGLDGSTQGLIKVLLGK